MRLSDRSGISLVEVSIALGMMGVVVTGLAAYQGYFARAIRGVTQKASVTTALGNVQSVLAAPATCADALRNGSGAAQVSTDPDVPVSSGIDRIIVPGSTHTLLQRGGVQDGARLTSMQIVRRSDFQVDGPSYTANAELVLTWDDPSAREIRGLGVTTHTRSLSLRVRTSSVGGLQNITGCQYTASGEEIACVNMGGSYSLSNSPRCLLEGLGVAKSDVNRREGVSALGDAGGIFNEGNYLARSFRDFDTVLRVERDADGSTARHALIQAVRTGAGTSNANATLQALNDSASPNGIARVEATRAGGGDATVIAQRSSASSGHANLIALNASEGNQSDALVQASRSLGGSGNAILEAVRAAGGAGRAVVRAMSASVSAMQAIAEGGGAARLEAQTYGGATGPGGELAFFRAGGTSAEPRGLSGGSLRLGRLSFFGRDSSNFWGGSGGVPPAAIEVWSRPEEGSGFWGENNQPTSMDFYTNGDTPSSLRRLAMRLGPNDNRLIGNTRIEGDLMSAGGHISVMSAGGEQKIGMNAAGLGVPAAGSVLTSVDAQGSAQWKQLRFWQSDLLSHTTTNSCRINSDLSRSNGYKIGGPPAEINLTSALGRTPLVCMMSQYRHDVGQGGNGHGGGTCTVSHGASGWTLTASSWNGQLGGGGALLPPPPPGGYRSDGATPLLDPVVEGTSFEGTCVQCRATCLYYE